MVDANQVLYGITVIASLVVIGGGAVAFYVYWSWRRFASGNWTIRSIGFYPQAKNIKIEQTVWMEAASGETLPPETLSIKASEDDPWTPVGGLTRFKFTGTMNPPAVLVYFVIINPNLNPAVVKELVFTVNHLDDERIYRFLPTHFAEKGGSTAQPLGPASLQFKDFWGSLLVQPASCSAHRLVLIPFADLEFNLVAGEYEYAIEFVFESLFRIMKMIFKGKRRIAVKADIDKDAEEAWKRKEPVILPSNLLHASTSHVKQWWQFQNR